MLLLTGNLQEAQNEIGKYAVEYCLERNKFKGGAFVINIGRHGSRKNTKGFESELFNTLIENDLAIENKKISTL